MDCSKAFDTCKFETLFKKLLDKGLPPIVVRTLMFMYEQQYARVRWDSAVSNTFTITNGTRQCSVASPTLWCVYLDSLVNELRELEIGCQVGGVFMGVVVYAHDILLMAPNRCAMQEMLSKCELYANKNNIMFNTDHDPKKSKSKCIQVIGNKKNVAKPSPLTLCGRDLPWVSSANHLGHELHESGSMELESKMKKAEFINKSVEVRETFNFANPVEILSATKLSCSSFYDSVLRDFKGPGAMPLFSSWTTAVKLAWSVPRGIRTYLVQQVLSSGLTSAKVDIMSRFVNFFRGLRTSPSPEVQIMANLTGRDIRITTGGNLRLLEQTRGLDPWLYVSTKMKES